MLPSPSAASCWKAALVRSRPLAAQPGQRSATVTVTDLPASGGDSKYKVCKKQREHRKTEVVGKS